MMEIEDKIKNYILENFLFTDDPLMLDKSTSFSDSGIIDSTGILEVITFVEEEFKIKIVQDEMRPENLDSVERLTRFIEGKLGL